MKSFIRKVKSMPFFSNKKKKAKTSRPPTPPPHHRRLTSAEFEDRAARLAEEYATMLEEAYSR